MRVATPLIMSIIFATNASFMAYGQRDQAKLPHKTYLLYFPNVAVPRDGGISLIRIVISCGRVAAVTRIPDDWYIRTLRPATESGPEWAEFKLASNAVDFEAGHGASRLRSMKSLNGAIKVEVEDESCFDVVVDIEDDMVLNGFKIRLRRNQLRLRT